MNKRNILKIFLKNPEKNDLKCRNFLGIYIYFFMCFTIYSRQIDLDD